MAFDVAQAQEPDGPEHQVNSYTTDRQEFPRVAAAGDGSFLVAWQSYGSVGSDTSTSSVQARLFSADGLPEPQFQVNSVTSQYQGRPAVAAQPDGSFVVVWQSYGGYGDDTSGFSIQLRRFGPDGAPLAQQSQVNSYTSHAQTRPRLAVGADSMIVVWQSEGSDGSDDDPSSVHARILDSDGLPTGSDFQVNTSTFFDQYDPDVALVGDGSFVVVWTSVWSAGSDDDGTSVQGQRLTPLGAFDGPEFQVNSYTTDSQRSASVATRQDGSFVVVWASEGSSGTDDDGSIQARFFSPTGVPQGTEFEVNSYTTNPQFEPDVGALSDGRFVVSWSSFGSPGSDADDSSVQARLVDQTGVLGEPQFQVNSYTTGFQAYPSLAVFSDRGFVVTWLALASDADPDHTARAQRFRVDLFRDGFETGDTSAWTSTVP